MYFLQNYTVMKNDPNMFYCYNVIDCKTIYKLILLLFIYIHSAIISLAYAYARYT